MKKQQGKFVPQLVPNFKKGQPIDWHELIKDPSEWLVSEKYDGGRVEISLETGDVRGRSLKDIPSFHIKAMAKDVALSTHHHGILEAEFYSPDMNFAEIMHFFRSEDVTSEKSKKKYENLWERTEQGTIFIYRGIPYPLHYLPRLNLDKDELKKVIKWEFVGRTPEWLTTWDNTLKFYIFDYLEDDADTKLNRYNQLRLMAPDLCDDAVLIPQVEVYDVDTALNWYDKVVERGGEGLMFVRKNSTYKFGRHTLKAAQMYKMKDDEIKYEGVIVDVEEGTIAREGSERTVNELGRSRTSQLAEDRVPGGFCKGFTVKMDDGRITTVSLNGYNHQEKKDLLYGKSDWIGVRIMFTGMAPVKEGGSPRSAHYTKGNIIEAEGHKLD